MKITRITAQTKRPDRYSVYVDNEYAFALSEAVLLESGLHPKQELSTAAIKEYKRLAAEDKAYVNALRYASIRPRSQQEMKTYLSRKQVSSALTAKIMQKLSKIGLLNDRAFANQWVENRRLLKPVSLRRLRQELMLKGIDKEIIKDALQGQEKEEATALNQLVKKLSSRSTYKAEPKKLMQYLLRQGFNYEDVKQAMSEYLSVD